MRSCSQNGLIARCPNKATETEEGWMALFYGQPCPLCGVDMTGDYRRFGTSHLVWRKCGKELRRMEVLRDRAAGAIVGSSGRLYQCPECGRLARQKPGEDVYSFHMEGAS